MAHSAQLTQAGSVREVAPDPRDDRRPGRGHDKNTSTVGPPQAGDPMRRNGGGAKVAPTALLDPPAEGVNDGWADLLGRVKAMLLRLQVGEDSGSLSQPRGREAPVGAADLRACIAALDQLAQALRYERGQRRQLEREVSEARAALANARAALVGTRTEERQARYLALHDSLTSLPNRRFFLERLDQALRSVTPQRPGLAVLYIDLNDFKPVNDVHGHGVGDELLRIIAARLNRAVRPADCMSRLGGDEFGCVVADLPTRNQLSQLVQKLIDAASAPVTVGDRLLTVHPSIGIATYPADGASAEALLKSADRAMYHAKRHCSGFAFSMNFEQHARQSVQELAKDPAYDAAATARSSESSRGRDAGPRETVTSGNGMNGASR